MSEASVHSLHELARVRKYRRRPAEWICTFLPVRWETLFWDRLPEYAGHRWDSTIQFPGEAAPRPCPNPLVAFLQAWADGHRFIAVESATGLGKTFVLGCGGLWYLDTHRPGIIRTYAPTATTLEENMWGYIGEVWNPREVEGEAKGFGLLHPQALLTKDLHVYLLPEEEARQRWAMMGYLAQVSSGGQVQHGAESAAGAQGGHHENMTLVVEEATGVDRRIWNALDFTMTGPGNQLVAVGNPDAWSDALHQLWLRSSTVRIRLSGLDAPNYVCRREIIPGGFSREFEDMMLEKFKGNRQHPLFLSRTRGICPSVSGRGLFDAAALDAVEKHHRLTLPQAELAPGQEISDLPWQKPLFRIEHHPERWRGAILALARAGGWGEVLGEDITDELLGVLDIEGTTEIYRLPDPETLGLHSIAIDVAGDYKEGDRHSIDVTDVLTQETVATVDLVGPRQCLTLIALALGYMYRVRRVRDLQEEALRRAMEPEHLAAQLYLESERLFRVDHHDFAPDHLRGLWQVQTYHYPTIAWEMNGVGSLHLVGPFASYPALYFDRNQDVRGAKYSRRFGWWTTPGPKGTRIDIIEALRDWGMLLAYRPGMMPSELLWQQAKVFAKDKDSDVYKAQPGHKDDVVMAKGINLAIRTRIPKPAPAEMPKAEMLRGARERQGKETKRDLFDAPMSGMGSLSGGLFGKTLK